jgi:uncharacterized repeat protein (TIGR01451 family)
MQRRALAAGSLIVAAAIAGSSDATASRAVITISSTPTVQALDTTVVARLDASRQKPVAALRFGTATFRVVVTNPGDVDLTEVTVDDLAAPGCNRNIGTLAAGASLAYVCRAPNIGRNFTNRLTASGLIPASARTLAGTTRATAATTAKVTVKEPRRRSRIPKIFASAPKATG